MGRPSPSLAFRGYSWRWAQGGQVAGLFWALTGGEPSGTLVSLNTFLTSSKEWGFLSQNYYQTGLRACQR